MIRLLALLIISTTLCYAADPQVRVTVDRNKIYEGDSITLTVSVENGNSYPQLNISDIEDFQIVTGPSQSSNMQWVNGEVSSSHSLVYVMAPRKKGELFIPKLTIKAEGKTYKSEPIAVTVYERNDQSASDKKGNPPESKYFIEASVDKSKPYRGEQITLTYTIYTKVDISGFDIKKIPRFQGFWTHELYTPRNLQLREVMRGGTKWYAGTVKKVALFPTRSGTIDIEPLTALIGIRVEDRSQRGIFSNMFATTKNHSISSNSVQIDVTSLPPNSGKVSAAVGDWAITSRITENDIKQNEAVTLTIRLRGKGNLQAVDIQAIHFPDEIEVFDPTIKVEEHPQGDVIAGMKTIEYVLIPRGTGNIKLPSVELVYFDLRQKQWRVKATQPIVLKVSPGDRNYSTEIGFTKKEVSLMGRDIRFADHRAPTWRRTDAGMVSPWTVTFLFAAAIFYFIPWFLTYTETRVAATAGSRQARKALKSALESLNNYTGNPSTDYRSIQSALTTFLNLKENTQKERSTRDILNALKTHDVKDNIISQIENILIRGDAVRFAPVSQEKSKTDFQTMSTALEELDNRWCVK